jgi:aminopeptidase N
MVSIRFSILGVVLCILSACASPNDPAKNELSTPYTLKSGGDVPKLQQGLSLEHADLSFSFDFNQEILTGSAVLTLNSDHPRTEFSVDLDKRFTLQELWLNGYRLMPHQYSNYYGELAISLGSPIHFPATLKINYSGHPRTPINAPWDGGVMWEKTPQGAPWLATAVQGEGCDLFWPCIDHPFGEPKHVDLRITVPDNLVAASNGVLVDVTHTDNKATYHWQTKSVHNTYGIALNIAPYELLQTEFTSVYGNQFPIMYYYLPGNKEQAEALFKEIPPMINFFEDVVGPYPFSQEKVGVVHTPHLGMEHQTINAYGNDYRKDEFGFDWLLQHEFAHEWFGNQLTNDNWDHMWLHEGLGSYMQPLYAQYLHGDEAYLRYLKKQRKSLLNTHPLVSNKLLEVEQVYENSTGPGIDIYYKGSWVMHTLRYLIGDDAFFKSVTEIVYGTATPTPGSFSPIFKNTRNFIDIVNQNSQQDLNWFFDVYLYQPILPKLIVSRAPHVMTLQWQTPQNRPFPMPVDVSINGVVTTVDLSKTHYIAVEEEDTVVIDPASKILKYEPSYENTKNQNDD